MRYKTDNAVTDFLNQILRFFLRFLRFSEWVDNKRPTLSINYVGMSKDMEKRLPQL